MKYRIINCPLKKGGKVYQPGEEVELTPEKAEYLISSGIQLVIVPEPVVETGTNVGELPGDPPEGDNKPDPLASTPDDSDPDDGSNDNSEPDENTGLENSNKQSDESNPNSEGDNNSNQTQEHEASNTDSGDKTDDQKQETTGNQDPTETKSTKNKTKNNN